MSNPQLKLRLDPGLVKEASAVLQSIGMTPTAAVSALFAQIVRERALPFRPDGSMDDEGGHLVNIDRRITRLEVRIEKLEQPAGKPGAAEPVQGKK